MYAVQKYYRKIYKNVDNIKNSIDIASLLIKSQEVDSNISDNLELINTNKSNTSDNLELINTNKNNISDNLELINTNKNNISDNLTKIDNNESNISDNLTKINNIEENNIKIYDEVFNDTYDIINKSSNFNENMHLYKLFEKTIENNMVSGELIINTIINYKYYNLENDINRLTHLYQFYDDKNELFYSITLDNHDFGVPSNSDKNILNIKDNFCFNIDNKDKIKIVLSLTRINEWGTGNINLQMIDNNSINIIYKEKTDISDKFDEHNKKIKAIDDEVSFNNKLIS